jgi:hypothetical protein
VKPPAAPLAAEPPLSSETARLAAAMANRTLPKEQWTHEAHLRVGLWHVLHFNASEALVLLRERISQYNESVGTLNTDTSGYHETITRFYVGLIAWFADGENLSEPIEAIARRLIDAYGDRNLPLHYYSRERLFSVEARRGWVEPDLAPCEWLTVPRGSSDVSPREPATRGSPGGRRPRTHSVPDTPRPPSSARPRSG